MAKKKNQYREGVVVVTFAKWMTKKKVRAALLDYETLTVKKFVATKKLSIAVIEVPIGSEEHWKDNIKFIFESFCYPVQHPVINVMLDECF